MWKKAEAPGNRTQQRRLSTTSIGFEVREGHQTLFASFQGQTFGYQQLPLIPKSCWPSRNWPITHIAPVAATVDFLRESPTPTSLKCANVSGCTVEHVFDLLYKLPCVSLLSRKIHVFPEVLVASPLSSVCTVATRPQSTFNLIVGGTYILPLVRSLLIPSVFIHRRSVRASKIFH